MLRVLNEGEVKAVLGHEIGHLKHRDVQIMTFLSFLPALFYILAESLFWSSMWGGYRGRDEGGSGIAILIAFASLAAYYVLTVLILGFSRLREYYADRHSSSIVEEGNKRLASALLKIASSAKRVKGGGSTSFKALFIHDPDASKVVPSDFRSDLDRKLAEVASRKLTFRERLAELFSTHPNLTKRIRALLAE